MWYRKQAGLCLILHFSAVGVSFFVTWNYSQELPHSLENDLWLKSRRVFHLENCTGALFHNLWGDLPCTATAAIHCHWSWVWESLWHCGSKCSLQQWEIWGGGSSWYSCTLAEGVCPCVTVSQINHCILHIVCFWCLKSTWPKTGCTAQIADCLELRLSCMPSGNGISAFILVTCN